MKQVEVNKEVRNSEELLAMFRFQYALFYKNLWKIWIEKKMWSFNIKEL